jgi:hypothetical protein
MDAEKCRKCGCIRLAHTGKGGPVTVGHGMVVSVGQGYCIPCINKPTPCFAFEN